MRPGKTAPARPLPEPEEAEAEQLAREMIAGCREMIAELRALALLLPQVHHPAEARSPAVVPAGDGRDDGTAPFDAA